MNKYRIISITQKEGKDRKDGRYPLRIGRICKQPDPVKGYPLYIEYICNADGSDYSNNFLRTSVVHDVYMRGNIIQIETKNSVYRFEECNDSDK